MAIDLTPAELYEAIASGPNREAEAQLYRNLNRNERFYILKQNGPQDFEDILHNAWVIVKTAMEGRRIKHGENPFHYAHGVVRNLCLEAKRQSIHIVPSDERMAA